MDRRALAAWAGMIGPVLFVAVFTLEGWLRPGYHPVSMFVSELSLGPRGWIQIGNFVIAGLLLVVFARGVAAACPAGRASRVGPGALAAVGVLFVASGPLVMDPADTPRSAWSWHGTLHQLFGALAFTLFPVSCFVFWRRFRDDPAWRSLRWWTLIAGVVIVVAIVLMRLAAMPPAPPNVLNRWIGLTQRTAIVTYLAWVFTFALALRRQGRGFVGGRR